MDIVPKTVLRVETKDGLTYRVDPAMGDTIEITRESWVALVIHGIGENNREVYTLIPAVNIIKIWGFSKA